MHDFEAEWPILEDLSIVTDLDENLPPPRRSHMQFVRNSKLYIIAGADKKQFHFSDMWSFDMEMKKWERIFYKNEGFLGRRRGSVVYLPDSDTLFTLCGTRPALSTDDQTNVTASDRLYDLDSFDIFQFGDDLKSVCFYNLVKNCNDCENLIDFMNSSEKIQNELENVLESGFRDRFSMMIGYEVKTANFSYEEMEMEKKA